MAELVHCYNFGTRCNEKKKVLIMVNSRSMSAPFAMSLWPSFDTKICADGGANRLFDGLDSDQIAQYHPDFIIGDLDSVRQDVCSAFSAAGTAIIQDKDQEYNDLDKCLHHVSATSKGQCNKTSIVVLGGYGCRFDQEIATIHALYKWSHKFQRIVVLSDTNSTELLTAGWHHKIPIQGALKAGNTCGLLPMGGKVNCITTSGLVWNLNEEFLELGQRISTSNLIAEDTEEVTVVCSEDLLWTCSIQF